MRGGLHRRGMSPLIATVLLMAFAVALGGMIMNWSIDASSKSGDCELIKIHVSQLCAQDDKIFLTLRNDKESVPLRGIKLSLIESSIESTLSIKDSALTPGQPLQISIPAATTFSTQVDVLAVVGSENNPFTCTDPKERAAPIRQC
jgi:flagellin-like protein